MAHSGRIGARDERQPRRGPLACFDASNVSESSRPQSIACFDRPWSGIGVTSASPTRRAAFTPLQLTQLKRARCFQHRFFLDGEAG